RESPGLSPLAGVDQGLANRTHRFLVYTMPARRLAASVARLIHRNRSTSCKQDGALGWMAWCAIMASRSEVVPNSEGHRMPPLVARVRFALRVKQSWSQRS